MLFIKVNGKIKDLMEKEKLCLIMEIIFKDFFQRLSKCNDCKIKQNFITPVIDFNKKRYMELFYRFHNPYGNYVKEFFNHEIKSDIIELNDETRVSWTTV